jgi:hypothetical protein
MSYSKTIQNCLKRLEKARAALQRLDQATDLPETESAWSDLIMAAASIYSKLENGSKVSGHATAWYGRVKHERKNDSLLSYIHHARNADEHCVEDITRIANREAQIRFHEPYDPAKLEGKQIFFGRDLRGNPTFRGSEGAPFSIEAYNEPTLVLVPVRDPRYNDKFAPPDKHLGQQLADTTPRAIGHLAVAYLERLINDASAMGV